MSSFVATTTCLGFLLICFKCVSTDQHQSGSGVFSGSGEVYTPSPVPPVLPAFQIPPVTYGNLSCGRYELLDQLCRPFMFYPVIYNYSRPNHAETLQDLNGVFGVLGEAQSIFQCASNALLMLCYFTFPFCDPAFNVPVYQPICRWDCEIMRDFVCPAEWAAMQKLEGIITFGAVDRFDCNLLPYANAGEAPMCVSTLDKGGFPDLFGGHIPSAIRSGDRCYYGKGRGYSGTVSVTQSGYTCQDWDTYLPHPHYLNAYQYPELAGGHNYCRNPGHKGQRPWCFTTNRTVRWEYCDIPQCEPSPTCQLYTGSVCRTNGTIGMDYVYIDTSIATQEVYENKLITVFNVLRGYPQCVSHLSSLLCHTTFPLCDLSHPTPRPHKVCNNYCQQVSQECQVFLMEFRNFQHVGTFSPIIIPTDCDNDTITDTMNGGTSPECYTPPDNSPILNTTTTCYNTSTNGTNYVGVVNTTISGYTCQLWDESTPQSHPLTSLFRRSLHGHAYCRNPDGRGSRPWCYTTNSSVRWEYCAIPSCTLPESNPLLPLWAAGVAGGVAALILALIIAIIIICACCCVSYHRKVSYTLKEGEGNANVHSEEMKQFYYKARNPLYAKVPLDSLQGCGQGLSDVPLPEYSREKLVYICDLGEGHFGLVIRAEAKGIIPGEDNLTVAVKVLKEGASSSTKSEFFKEAALMVGFNHPNILRLLGVCIEQEPLCMIFEYMEMGDLNNFLRQNAPAHLHSFPVNGPKTLPERLSIKNLVDISLDVASGLAYLSVNHYVHRDLATRNCLVGANLKVKIADFGLSQDVYSSDYFRLGDSELLPIRWMPPEAILLSKFTIDSDVWSYGVVLWEIFSYGIQPYFGMSNEEVIQYVRSDKVLKKPEGTPQEMYDLMLDCWNVDPSERPKAAEIAEGLKTWTPEISAKIEVEAKHPDYQNMSTILEWARKSREVGGQYYVLEAPHEGEEGGENKENNGHIVSPVAAAADGYDHLSPIIDNNSISNNGVAANGSKGTNNVCKTVYGDAPIY